MYGYDLGASVGISVISDQDPPTGARNIALSTHSRVSLFQSQWESLHARNEQNSRCAAACDATILALHQRYQRQESDVRTLQERTNGPEFRTS